eukprot:CAMPEP_0181286508 /NCGR_PEP_ID=MMETSP1097-20121128/16635_1 /TAXON_ID=35684 /ORGANISM="Pseudopedinella elastica, Strain CCMP716" /LENGTH=69 /DNA_ID=CAMNT_0023390335 /DNA_START=3 /DNA_END=208 /DNA_ORIENTATION=+
MIGDIRQEVGVTTILLAHDPVLVIAELGGLQPHGAILLVGVAIFLQALDRRFDLAVFVQGGFQEIDIEL